ncbi:hypothetical protein ACOV11_24390, partial [Vibrio natriegens]
MSRSMTYVPFLTLGLGLLAAGSLQIGNDVTLARQIDLLFGTPAEEFADFAFVYAQLPRMVMAVMV